MLEICGDMQGQYQTFWVMHIVARCHCEFFLPLFTIIHAALVPFWYNEGLKDRAALICAGVCSAYLDKITHAIMD